LRGVYAALAAFFILTAYAAPVSVSQVKEQALSGYLYYVFFESSPASPCATRVNTQLSYPARTGSFTLNTRKTLCLWAQVSGFFAGGECVFILYASSTSAGSVSFALSLRDSKGAVLATLGSGSVPVSSTKQELISFFACSSFTANAGDYLALSLTGGGVGKTKYTVYFGASTPTDFQVVKSADSA
jgi:hypothetical protein